MNRKKLAILLLALFAAICILSLVSCVNVDDNDNDNDNSNNGNVGDNVDIGDNNNGDNVGDANNGSNDDSNNDGNDDVNGGGNNDDNNGDDSNVTEYTVIWKNDDGSILAIDQNVKEGSIPAFNGATPTKEGNEQYSYVFSGWEPEVGEVREDMVYTAKFTERHNGPLVAGVDPVICEDGKTIQYGFYPQTHISDKALLEELNALTPSEINGWYLHNGEYYAKETAKVYNGESYTFDDGTPIVDGGEYWFKCEPIKWQILSEGNGMYYLLSCSLLDVYNYYTDYSNRTIDGATVYANNYAQSSIRGWLNDDFYNTAFAINSAYVKETAVNNGASTTDAANNPYACANTQDKVYLPSYQDYLNADYGFDSNAADTSLTRECKTTDYARARGAWCNTQDSLKYNGTYWTRSPSDAYYYCAWNVNSGGYLSSYAVDGDSHCVRPCISVYVAE